MTRHHRSIRSAIAAVAGGMAFSAFTVAACGALAGQSANPSMRISNLTLADLDLSRAAYVQIARERNSFMSQKHFDNVPDSLSLSQRSSMKLATAQR